MTVKRDPEPTPMPPARITVEDSSRKQVVIEAHSRRGVLMVAEDPRDFYNDYLDLTRDDARELGRILTAWGNGGEL